MSDYICKSCEHYLVCKHADQTITSCSQYFELVRCKDCKRFVDNREAFVTYCKRELKDLYVKPDDFCSYGERRDND